jgi:copper chaperone CopZ
VNWWCIGGRWNNVGRVDTDQIELSVPEMTCGHCEAAIKKEVSSVRGVASVVVDLDTKLVSVFGSGLDRGAVVAAIDEAGFNVG